MTGRFVFIRTFYVWVTVKLMIFMVDYGYCLCFLFFFLSFFYPFVLVGSFSPLEIAYIFVLSVVLLFFIKYMWRVVYIFSARLGSYMLSDIITSLCIFNVKVNWCSVFYTFNTYRGKVVEPLFAHMELVYYKSTFQFFLPLCIVALLLLICNVSERYLICCQVPCTYTIWTSLTP